VQADFGIVILSGAKDLSLLRRFFAPLRMTQRSADFLT